MENTHPLGWELSVLANTTPSMIYSPSNGSLDEWQRAARVKLSGLLGIDRFTQCDDGLEVEWKKEQEGFTEIRFAFNSEEGYTVPCHLLIPLKGLSEKPPVMICLQGHSTGMHISLGRPKFPGDDETVDDGDRDFAVQCVNKGLCAVTLEQRCFGERGGTPGPDCHSASMVALMTGRTVIGGRVWDIMRLIDVLEKYYADICDTDKIYCMGNSGGGTATFYASALETRIKAAMPSCAFSTFEHSIGAKRHCECNYIPQIGRYFDMADIAGMIAPRPIVIVSGTTDGIFPLEAAKHEFVRLKDIYYAASERPDNCAHVIGEQGHRFYADDAWPVFDGLTGE